MCEPERSRGLPLRGVLAAVGGVAVGAAVLRFAESAAEAIGVTALAVCILGTVFTVRFVTRHGGFGIIVKREAVNHTVMRAALAAPRRAIEPPRRVVEGVIIGEKEAVR